MFDNVIWMASLLLSYQCEMFKCLLCTYHLYPRPPGTRAIVGTCRDSAGDLCMLTSLPAGNVYWVVAVAWWWSFGRGIWAGISSGMSRGMGAGTLSVTRRQRCPALWGSRRILAGDLSASKERVDAFPASA